MNGLGWTTKNMYFSIYPISPELIFAAFVLL